MEVTSRFAPQRRDRDFRAAGGKGCLSGKSQAADDRGSYVGLINIRVQDE